KNGGTLIAFDKACGFVTQQFDLPIENAVKGLKKEEFYIPGTLIRANIDVNNTLAWGVQESVATAFERSRAFNIQKEEVGNSIDVVATYADDTSNLLMSGWILGGEHI